jgi:aryl sulfotransferase
MKNRSIAPTRVIRDYLSNSLVWKDFLVQGGFVEGDLVVADPFKAGTTWTQRILQQILANGEEGKDGLSDTSPWLDSSWGNHDQMLSVLKEQKKNAERRVIKSHVPADTIPIDEKARYFFVGRNGKDVGLSFHNYLKNFTADTMNLINRLHAEWSADPTPLVIPESMREFFDLWLDKDGYGCCDLFDIMGTWWKVKELPNVLLVHYQQLKEDLREQIVRIAEFIDVDVPLVQLDTIVAHCSFDYMRDRADRMAPFNGTHMSSAKSFFHKGPDRDFRSELTAEQIKRFNQKALKKLGSECAHWLETGERLESGNAGQRATGLQWEVR